MKPSIGRVVWVNMPVHSDQLCAGLVTYVHKDDLVNLVAFDRNGDSYPLTFVKFYHGDDGNIPVGQCGWMPYQVQAAAAPKPWEATDAKLAEIERRLAADHQAAKETDRQVLKDTKHPPAVPTPVK